MVFIICISGAGPPFKKEFDPEQTIAVVIDAFLKDGAKDGSKDVSKERGQGCLVYGPSDNEYVFGASCSPCMKLEEFVKSHYVAKEAKEAEEQYVLLDPHADIQLTFLGSKNSHPLYLTLNYISGMHRANLTWPPWPSTGMRFLWRQKHLEERLKKDTVDPFNAQVLGSWNEWGRGSPLFPRDQANNLCNLIILEYEGQIRVVNKFQYHHALLSSCPGLNKSAQPILCQGNEPLFTKPINGQIVRQVLALTQEESVVLPKIIFRASLKDPHSISSYQLDYEYSNVIAILSSA